MEVLERRVIEDWMMVGRRVVPLQPDADGKYQSEKRCVTCGFIKGFEEFRRTGPWLATSCDACVHAKKLADRLADPETNRVRLDRRKALYQRDAESRRAEGRQYHAARRLVQPKLIREAEKQWDLAHPEAARLQQRRADFKRRWGLSLQERDDRILRQAGGCAICGDAETDSNRLVMDHDHRCCNTNYSCGDCLRALLCGRCNKGLGMFGDDPHILEIALGYVRSHNG